MTYRKSIKCVFSSLMQRLKEAEVEFANHLWHNWQLVDAWWQYLPMSLHYKRKLSHRAVFFVVKKYDQIIFVDLSLDSGFFHLHFLSISSAIFNCQYKKIYYSWTTRIEKGDEGTLHDVKLSRHLWRKL